MKEIYYDLYRWTGKTDKKSLVKLFLKERLFRKMVYYRRLHKKNAGLIRLLNSLNNLHLSVDMPASAEVGPGLLFIHGSSIAINSKAVIGRNCTILKGATIGVVIDGKRAGVPVIGDNVYIGANATVIGGVKIGDDSMICANAFVDFDVPPSSLVIGNPATIHQKVKPSEKYIYNSIEKLS